MRKYGADIVERLSESGFEVQAVRYARELSDEQRRLYALHDQTIFLCTESAGKG